MRSSARRGRCRGGKTACCTGRSRRCAGSEKALNARLMMYMIWVNTANAPFEPWSTCRSSALAQQTTTIEPLQKGESERGHSKRMLYMQEHDMMACTRLQMPRSRPAHPVVGTRVGRVSASHMKAWGLYGPKCGIVIQSRTQWRATEAAVASNPAQRICSIGFGSESSRDSQAARATLARNQRASARWQTAGERRRTS